MLTLAFSALSFSLSLSLSLFLSFFRPLFATACVSAPHSVDSLSRAHFQRRIITPPPPYPSSYKRRAHCRGRGQIALRERQSKQRPIIPLPRCLVCSARRPACPAPRSTHLCVSNKNGRGEPSGDQARFLLHLCALQSFAEQLVAAVLPAFPRSFRWGRPSPLAVGGGRLGGRGPCGMTRAQGRGGHPSLDVGV